jgi:hypothetical protein
VFAIHREPGVAWQARRASDFSEGLAALGIPHVLTNSRHRISDVAILFGTTFWKAIEDDGQWLLVDRASIGDPDYVSLVWNGHGRRGDHRVPKDHDDSRWKALGVELLPQEYDGKNVVICGQTATYSPLWDRIEDWYASIPDATHFRRHPAGTNPTGLPEKTDWIDSQFHVLNSSVAVQAAILGKRVTVHDEGCMAYGAEDREAWARWLAWTQWRWEEIRSGIPHLFESRSLDGSISQPKP